MKLSILLATLLAAVLFGATLPETLPPTAAPSEATTWSVDGTHSSMVFRIKHAGLAWFQGRFNELSGEIVMDDEAPEEGSVSFNVSADSVDTSSSKRDQHIKSPDFLNATEFPLISFKSDSVKALDEGRYEVAGKMTLHGEIQPLTVTVQETGRGEFRGNEGRGYEAIFSIQRSAFGIDSYADMLSDEIRISVSLEAYKR